MIGRKCVAAYFTVMVVVFGLTFGFTSMGGSLWQTADNYLSSMLVIAIFTVPAVFIYGIFASIVIEHLIGRTKLQGPVEWLVSGTLHVIMGILFGLFLQGTLFSIFGAFAALIFFVMDKSVQSLFPRLRQRNKAAALAAPLILLLVFVGIVQLTAPPLPPFTTDDAVAFATQGDGSVTDLFPKEVGISKLTHQGYAIERETKVETGSGKETYYIYFIERWRKGEEAGAHSMKYKVTRGSMGAEGSEGADPPYRR
ncbi:hypothetical protein M6D81_01080 [Paenibacillus sp. J5C_2022]|uniref:hypothetical protein n=1 Tax=Paenibacillus sp. J5C2022 TaxID=2977129 RepID=UPI0021D0FBE6|nr:hypothetical protein [Paenibacillus sp. J5C2022]MCU6707287.1 hypothetical protein [Paenibacillus sp. J5C2022]